MIGHYVLIYFFKRLFIDIKRFCDRLCLRMIIQECSRKPSTNKSKPTGTLRTKHIS